MATEKAPKDRRVSELEAQLAEVRQRLEESEGTIRAIKHGEVDAFVVQLQDGERVYSLRGSEHAYRAFVEHMRDGAVTVATDSTIVYSNRRFMDMLGLPHSRVAGSNFVDHVAPEDGYMSEALLQRAQQRESFGELSLVGRDGNRVPVHMFAFPVDLEGLKTICVLITDLTEIYRYRYDLEQMVESRTIDLADQNEELKRLTNAKNQLVARLALELDKPISDIQEIVSRLQPSARDLAQDQSADMAKPDVALIENSLIRLNALREDVAMLSEIESGEARLEYAAVDMRAIVLQAVEAARGPAQEKGIEITVSVPHEDVSFVTDARKIRHIIVALLLVCAESIESGPIRLTASVTSDMQARYEICTPGNALPVEDMQSILEGAVDSEAVRRLSETVPALSIWASRQMAKFMRGDVCVTRSDTGDCLSLTLPI